MLMKVVENAWMIGAPVNVWVGTPSTYMAIVRDAMSQVAARWCHWPAVHETGLRRFCSQPVSTAGVSGLSPNNISFAQSPQASNTNQTELLNGLPTEKKVGLTSSVE